MSTLSSVDVPPAKLASTLSVSPPEVKTKPAPLDPITSKILIIGAGVFGLSTAYHFQEDGFKDVVVLDRAVELPARDAASTDINKVIRSMYSDRFYTRLGREAIAKWKDPMWEGCYHESGVLVIGDPCRQSWYENDISEGSRVLALPDAESIRSVFPKSLQTTIPTQDYCDSLGSFTSYTGYISHDCGWTEATRAVKILIDTIVSRGVKIEGGKEVVMLLRSGPDGSGYTHGVKCRDGSMYFADRVIVATGSWTASNFPELELDKMCLATGHALAMIQLNPEEAERYRQCPVAMDSSTGLYVLPPDENNVIKTAVHDAGYTHVVIPSSVSFSSENPTSPPRKISTPRTILSHPEGSDGLRVPRTALEILRDNLRILYPELAQKPWAETRLCWYTDSPDSDWVIGEFPGDPGLFLATSGSGHAFKFLPNVGRLVLDILQGKASTATVAKFAVNREAGEDALGERAEGEAQELVLEDLCGTEDL
ncbi:FAD dependent oxidoreductase [Scleroderma citrinum]